MANTARRRDWALVRLPYCRWEDGVARVLGYCWSWRRGWSYWDSRWRRRLQWSRRENNVENAKKTSFLLTLYSSLLLLNDQNPLLFIGGKRDILSLLGTNLGHWFNREGSQLFAQSHYNELLNSAAIGGHLVFIRDQSWTLIQSGRISIVCTKSL